MRRRVGVPGLGVALCFAVLPAFAEAGAGGAAVAETTLEELVRQLGAKDHQERYRAYRELSARRDPKAIPLLAAALPGYPHMGQQYGFYVLQSYPIETSRRALQKLLGCDAPYLVVAAAVQLHRIGKEDRSAEMVAALARQVESSVRTAMVQRLYGLRVPAVQTAILAWLGDRKTPPAVFREAVYYLYSAKETRLARALHKDYPTLVNPGSRLVACACLHALGAGDPPADEKEFARLLGLEKLPYADFYKVRYFLGEAPHLGDKVKQALLGILKRETNLTILGAVAGIFERKPWRRAIPALRKLLDHKSTTVSKAAFDALAACPGGLGRDRLRALLAHQDPKRGLQAADALRRMDDPTGLPLVLGLARRPGPHRYEAVEALGHYRSHKAIPVLLAALEAPLSRVRQVAWTGLTRLLPDLFPYRRFDLRRLGYRPTAAPAANRQAVTRLKAWYSQAMRRSW